MANNAQEQISALMDGELEGSELQRALERLKADPESRDRWKRYHFVSDTLHNNLPNKPTLSIHERVAKALEDEPVILAPKVRRLRFGPVLKQISTLAAAASVTAVAILGMQYVNGEREQAPAMTAEVQNPSLELTPASAEANGPVDPALDRYLMNHNEYSVSSGMHGMLPYVRIVSEGSDQ